MKLFAYFLALLSIVCATLAVDVRNAVIVQFPDHTPDWTVDEAKQKFIEAKGVITHEYKIIKAFAGTIGAQVLETLSLPEGADVQKDNIVTIQNQEST